MNKLIPLTDEEFENSGLDECWRGYAYWDEEGYLVTIECHQGALDQLKPPDANQPMNDANNTDGSNCQERFVSRWMDTAIKVQDTFGKIEDAFMASPENEIRSAIWDMFGEYTRTLAAQLSDNAEDALGWLEWFAWECDFGRKPMEMTFADGETLMVVGASDLLAAIRTDENGCRVWNSTANALSTRLSS